MGTKKDSRFRTIQREYGKVFVVWFGGVYTHSKDNQSNSLLKIGDSVELVDGSTPDEVVLRNPKRPEIGTEKWRRTGIQGGEKGKEKFEEDWAKLLAGEKSIGMAREGVAQEEPKLVAAKEPPAERKERVEKKVDRSPFLEIFELAKDYEAVSTDVGVAVRFRESNNASSFRLAVNRRRGWKADEPLTDENTGETVVVVRSK